MAKKSDKKKRRVVTARQRVEKHETSDLKSLKLPEGAQLWKPRKAGTYRIDILNYEVGKGNPIAEPGDLYYERTYFVHRGIGPLNESYACPAKTFGKPCPICEEQAAMRRDPDSDQDHVKSLRPKERQLFNIIDVSSPAERKKGVQIWEESNWLFGKLLDKLTDDEEEPERQLFADYENGLTLKLTVSEEKNEGYTFYEVVGIEFKPRKEAYDEEEMLEQVFCLDELPAEVDYKKLKKIFDQNPSKDDDEDDPEEDEEDSDDDEEETPKKKAKKPAKKAKVEDEDEEEDDSEEDEESDDDEDDKDEPPAKKKGGKKLPTAKSKGIKKGSMVEHEDYDECEVIHISPDGTSLKLEDSDGEIHSAVGADECELIKPKKKVPPKKKASVDDDDDEDLDEEEEENDEDEDEPSPKSKKKVSKKSKTSSKKTSKKQEEEDEEEEESDDDEDSDEDDSDEDEDDD